MILLNKVVIIVQKIVKFVIMQQTANVFNKNFMI